MCTSSNNHEQAEFRKGWLRYNEFVRRCNDRPELFKKAWVRVLPKMGRFGIIIVKADK